MQLERHRRLEEERQHIEEQTPPWPPPQRLDHLEPGAGPQRLQSAPPYVGVLSPQLSAASITCEADVVKVLVQARPLTHTAAHLSYHRQPSVLQHQPQSHHHLQLSQQLQLHQDVRLHPHLSPKQQQQQQQQRETALQSNLSGQQPQRIQCRQPPMRHLQQTLQKLSQQQQTSGQQQLQMQQHFQPPTRSPMRHYSMPRVGVERSISPMVHTYVETNNQDCLPAQPPPPPHAGLGLHPLPRTALAGAPPICHSSVVVRASSRSRSTSPMCWQRTPGTPTQSPAGGVVNLPLRAEPFYSRGQ